MGPLIWVAFLHTCLLFPFVSSRAVNITNLWTLPQEGFPHFLRFFNDPATWDEAKDTCKSLNAELLTVETLQRRDAARAYLKEVDVLESVWVGLQRADGKSPFVWTGGGEPASEDPSFWQEALPAEPARLCVVLNPVYDFRWQSYSCSGPDTKPFVCQLEVPDWATGPEGCMVQSLPSLTVNYLPEPGVVELLSDCGLSGTKRIACKGAENQSDLLKRLSCDEALEKTSTWKWGTRTSRKWDTSTPSGSSTHSFNTRHKRQSGATSTSTDISLLPGVETDERAESMPKLLSPIDETTLIAPFAGEDQIEESTASALDHFKEETAAPAQSNHVDDLRPFKPNQPPINTHWIPSTTEQSITHYSTEATTVTNTRTPEILSTHITSTVPPKDITKPEEQKPQLPHPPFIQTRKAEGNQEKKHIEVSTQPPSTTTTTSQPQTISPTTIEMPANSILITAEGHNETDTDADNNIVNDNDASFSFIEQESLVFEKFKGSHQSNSFGDPDEEKLGKGLGPTPSTMIVSEGRLDTTLAPKFEPDERVSTVVPNFNPGTEKGEVPADMKVEFDSEVEPTTSQLFIYEEEIVDVPLNKEIVIQNLMTELSMIPNQNNDTVQEESRPTTAQNQTTVKVILKSTEENLPLTRTETTEEPKDTVTNPPTSTHYPRIVKKILPPSSEADTLKVSEDNTLSTYIETTAAPKETVHYLSASTTNPQSAPKTLPPSLPIFEIHGIPTIQSQHSTTLSPIQSSEVFPTTEVIGVTAFPTAASTQPPLSITTQQPTSFKPNPPTEVKTTHFEITTYPLPTTRQSTTARPATAQPEIIVKTSWPIIFSTKEQPISTVDPFMTQPPLPASSSAKPRRATAVESEVPNQDTPLTGEGSEESDAPKRNQRGRLTHHSNPFSFYPYFINKILG